MCFHIYTPRIKGGFMYNITGFLVSFSNLIFISEIILNFIRNIIIIKFLYPLVGFIISLDIGEPEIKKKCIGKNFSSSHLDPLIDPTLDPDLPPAAKTPEYQEILKIKELLGKPIKPIKHRKPICKDIKCPICGAPYTYIYNGGKKYSTAADEDIESHVCKVCGKQWFPSSYPKSHPPYKCPFCGRLLYLKRKRKEFDLYFCRHKDCHFYKENKVYYKFRNYFFNIHELEIASPAKPKINLSNSHFPPTIIGLALVMCINFGLCFRNCSLFLNQFMGIYVNHQTIYNWIEAFAYLIFPLISKLPIITASKFVIDETYERCKGKWHYFYACMNLDDHQIVSPHFSQKRNTKAVATTLMNALKRLTVVPYEIEIFHDCNPCYFLAIQLINQCTEFKLVSRPVKGLKGGNYIYRSYKNMIERFFGDAKVPYHIKRGFRSFNGAVMYNTLYSVHYNYFQHHNFKRYPKSMRIKLDTINPIAKWNKLLKMATNSQNPLNLNKEKQDILSRFTEKSDS